MRVRVGRSAYFYCLYETLNRRQRSFDSFDNAIKKGRTTALTLIANALFEMALSQKNLGATIYWLKIHGGPLWRQDQNYDVKHSGEVQHNVVADRQKLVEQLRRLNDTKPELMAELRELRRREHEILDQVAEKPAIETTVHEE
ncbi:MAG: hypothetical protein JO138_23660 [Acidobacteriaceae bacterium]|nr:hypothetical protein [Acidobacteriaceae bacterium]